MRRGDDDIDSLVYHGETINLFQTIPNAHFAESSVLERSIDTVTGPTPPGAGVMADATLTASSKQTSPVKRKTWLLGSC